MNNCRGRSPCRPNHGPRPKRECRDIHGILLFDKPIGMSSNAALQTVKRLYRARKAGHTGSLDPLASGLLPICFGEATKFSQFLLDADKHYEVDAKLGVRTTSGDSEGEVIVERSVSQFSSNGIETVLNQFRGNILQIPSMYSALKYQGQPLYKLARRGITVERNERPICINLLQVLKYQGNILRLAVKATKGTYIRTLIEDIGEALGCGAHVVALRRQGAGPYTADQMVSLETLEDTLKTAGIQKLNDFLLPLDSSLGGLPDLRLSETAAYYLRQGQPVLVPYAPTEGLVRLRETDNRFLGLGEILEDGRVAPRRLTQVPLHFEASVVN